MSPPKRILKWAVCLAVLLCLHAPALADIRLPAVFSDRMVLQKSGDVPIWGWADPGEEITVAMDGKSMQAVADGEGAWMVRMDLSDSEAGPFEMTVRGQNTVTIQDALVGEVWLASGQSNMAWQLENTTAAREEIARSANPLLREFKVRINPQAEPMEDIQGEWVAADPGTSPGFSAVGYYFAKQVQEQTGAPVGIINASCGGTRIEAWAGAETLDSIPNVQAERETAQREVESHPEELAAFVEGFSAWLKANSREDRRAGDPADFAEKSASGEDWVSVELPGEVSAAGLPEYGALWFRREVLVPAPEAGAALNLILRNFNGFDRVYWNGNRIGETTFDRFPGSGFIRRYRVPAELVRSGANILAIRIFAPADPAGFRSVPTLASIPLDGNWLARVEFELPPPDPGAPPPKPPRVLPPQTNAAAHLFNGMIHPLVPYAIQGVIWYQGESNVARADRYRAAFPLMIRDWRERWGRGDFPFYFCQLANHHPKTESPGEESRWAELREAQSMALALPNTGMAVLIDLGEAADIHPRNKKEAAERLARIALTRDYGAEIPYSGPVYQSMEVENGKIRLRFTHTHGGLQAKPLPETHDVETLTNKTAPLVRNSPDSMLEGFAVAGKDGEWVWAQAEIDGDSVLVWAEEISDPIAVRYAWANNPTGNLSNGAGLPAAPFRTDAPPQKAGP